MGRCFLVGPAIITKILDITRDTVKFHKTWSRRDAVGDKFQSKEIDRYVLGTGLYGALHHELGVLKQCLLHNKLLVFEKYLTEV